MKRPRADDNAAARGELPEELELRHRPGRGNGVFASRPLPVNWTWRDHPVCVADASGRRLPEADNPDELMQELGEGAAAGRACYASLIDGPCRMSYVQRHLDMQDTGEEELPEWARALRWTPDKYNALAATLQSNIARHAEGGGLVLNPMLRLANHSCEPNTDICWDPVTWPHECACGLGHYILRARRPIRQGEEVTFSYIGTGALCSPFELEERRALLQRRWGFSCACGLCARQTARGRLRPRVEGT